MSAYAQGHFLRHLGRLHRVLMAHHGVTARGPHVPRLLRVGWRRWAATYARGYDPADIVPPAALTEFLASLDAEGTARPVD